MQQQLPYVFVIDWDGTIVGKVDTQSHIYSLHLLMKRHRIAPAKRWATKDQPPAAFRSRLVRPGLAAFMADVRAHLGNVYFFVYTASERAWAMQEIAWVEQAHGVRFERPIFTRSDCTVDGSGTYRKSIGRVFPRIIRTIQRSAAYGWVFTPDERLAILEANLVIIDNNAVYTDRGDKLLLCPDYSYVHFENAMEYIPAAVSQYPAIIQHLLSMINAGTLCPTIISRKGSGGGGTGAGAGAAGETDNPMVHMAASYEWLATRCRAAASANTAYDKDTFWKVLRKIIVKNQLREFRPRTIAQVQKVVWSKDAARRRVQAH